MRRVYPTYTIETLRREMQGYEKRAHVPRFDAFVWHDTWREAVRLEESAA